MDLEACIPCYVRLYDLPPSSADVFFMPDPTLPCNEDITNCQQIIMGTETSTYASSLG